MVRTLLLYLVLTGFAVAGEGDGSHRIQSRFTVAGITLGMGLDRVLEIYPTAMVQAAAANCYRYGRAVRMPTLTRRVLTHHIGAGTLTLRFEPPGFGGGLSRVFYDRPFELSPLGIRKLLDRLSARFGPYGRILYRRKMEPAGRVVGFEWRNSEGDTMRVVVRHDPGNGGNGVRLNILARSAVRDAPMKTRGLSPSCGRH